MNKEFLKKYKTSKSNDNINNKGKKNRITNFLWIIVFVIIILNVMKLFSIEISNFSNTKKNLIKEIDTSKIAKKRKIFLKLDRDIKKALNNAKNNAEKVAEKELNIWVKELIDKMDNNYLDWYFGYWQQRTMEFKKIQYYIKDKLLNKNNSEKEILEDIKNEFEKRVLDPITAQHKIEYIFKKTMDSYTDTLSKELKNIKEKYKIPDYEWHEYLSDLSLVINNSNGINEIPLTVKTLTISTISTSFIAMRSISATVKPLATKISSKMIAKIGIGETTTLASKVGVKTVGKITSKEILRSVPIIITIWEIWDHISTVKKERAILRKNLIEQLGYLKDIFLHDDQIGIITVLNNIELKIASKYVVIDK